MSLIIRVLPSQVIDQRTNIKLTVIVCEYMDYMLSHKLVVKDWKKNQKDCFFSSSEVKRIQQNLDLIQKIVCLFICSTTTMKNDV
jgi:hypothetical protein